ncbi:hypothetical protein [Pseudomonas phage D6]|nr:hypothetical protein [Pseudomonas phage D6]
MSHLANQLYQLTRPTNSKSTDKLNAILATADALAERDPSVLKRISSLSIEWQQVNGDTVPVVEMTFTDPVPVRT